MYIFAFCIYIFNFILYTPTKNSTRNIIICTYEYIIQNRYYLSVKEYFSFAILYIFMKICLIFYGYFQIEREKYALIYMHVSVLKQVFFLRRHIIDINTYMFAIYFQQTKWDYMYFKYNLFDFKYRKIILGSLVSFHQVFL